MKKREQSKRDSVHKYISGNDAAESSGNRPVTPQPEEYVPVSIRVPQHATVQNSPPPTLMETDSAVSGNDAAEPSCNRPVTPQPEEYVPISIKSAPEQCVHDEYVPPMITEDMISYLNSIDLIDDENTRVLETTSNAYDILTPIPSCNISSIASSPRCDSEAQSSETDIRVCIS